MLKRLLCVALSLLLIFFITSCSAEKKETEKESCVATVNGEPITTEEYEYFRKKYKSQVLNECLSKYGKEYSEEFWQTEIDGVTPEKILHDRVIEECVMAKIQFLLMKEEGIYEDISFEGLKLKAEKFNSENENKEGVVGIKSIGMSQFYSYYLQTGIMELQNIYAEGKLKPADKEIQEKISKMTEEHSSYSEQEYESIAKSRLKSEKYEKYINELYEKAEIKEFEKDGKQS